MLVWPFLFIARIVESAPSADNPKWGRDSQLVRGAPSAYIKAGRSTLLGGKELTLPKEPKWRSVVFNVGATS
jgi:hypothetical protein